jgi:vacuolar-type H+-ATPase subunit E/Vma4
VNPPSSNNGEDLCRGILASARTEADRLIRKAHDEAAHLLSGATQEENNIRQQRLEKAIQEATRQRDRILATLPVETRRLRATRVEALLQSIHDEVRRRIVAAEGFDTKEILIASAAYAITRMAGSTFVVTISPADYTALGASLAGEIIHRTEKTGIQLQILEDPSITRGGVIIHDAAHRQEWDNRLTSRLDRLWPDLRHRLAAALPADEEHRESEP